MGFYVRKSVKAGPFRFNLSKSGVGVSAGIPGFRVGTGPRGNYVHAGRGGVYYRATFGGGRRRPSSPGNSVRPSHSYDFIPSDGIVMADVTGASAEELHATGPGELVDQLNAAARAWRLGPWAAVLLLVVLIAKPIIGVVLLVPGVPGVFWLWMRDRARRSVVVFYDVNDEAAVWFEALNDAFESFASCSRVWRINAAGRVETTYQYKVNSGANKIVNRADARVSFSPPALFKTNIKVPTITAGKSALLFLPDRVLARTGKTYSDATYEQIDTVGYPQRFIEGNGRPRDARQVDTTWQFVNVRGGPDRRYKNNRQLPIMLYGQLELASQNGLFWILNTSRPEPCDHLAKTVRGAPATLRTVHVPPDSAVKELPVGAGIGGDS